MRQLKITKQVTNRDEKSLDRYFQEISKIELITAQQEVELAQRIKEGDQHALERLVRVNLRFVVSVAKQYQNQGLRLSDLINEGNIGLVKAAKRFDETRGFKFISYAVWWIRQAIMQALSEQSRVIRLPLNKIGQLSKINKVYASLEQQNERPPSHEEIAKTLGISIDHVKQALKNSKRHLSMDAPFREGESSNLYDLIQGNDLASPDAHLMYSSLQTEVSRALDTLPEREAIIVRMYYGLEESKPSTFSEIGSLLDLTRERVRQLREKGLRKLRNTSSNKVLKLYLG